MRVVAGEWMHGHTVRSSCSGPHVSGGLWRLWILLLCSMLGVVVVSCQPLPRPTPQPPEPHFLPALQAPQPQPAVATVAPSAEQRAAFSAAEALRSSGQYLQARQAFADFVRRYPESSLADDALLALGHISSTLEQYAPAVTYYRGLLERFPRSERVPEAQLGLGVALYHTQAYANSLVALRQYVTLVPTSPHEGLAHYYLGAVALKQQRYPDAIAEFKAAVETRAEPAMVQQAREYIASTVSQMLTVDALVPLAQQYAKTYPGDLILERLVQEYRRAGKQADEADALQRLTTAFPNAPGTQDARARLRALQALLTTDRSKIGVLLPLSGPGSRVGTRALRGIELALATVQERDPAAKLSLVIRDSTENVAPAQEALRALVNEEHVIGVIGPLFSRTATELASLADQLAVPLISPYARDSDFPALSPYAFRNSVTDAMQTRVLAEHAMGVLKLRRFVILHPEEAYVTALRDRFREQVLQRQGEIVAVLSYSPQSSNISRAIARLQGLQYDAIFLPEYADKVGTLVAQLVAQHIQGIQLLGTDGWNAPGLVATNARLLEGAVFVDGFFANASSPAVQTFVERFRSRYNETPGLLAAQAYDTLLICAQVLKAGAQTSAQLRDGLLRVRNFAGVSGLTSMGDKRDAEKVPYLLTVKGGQIVQLNAEILR